MTGFAYDSRRPRAGRTPLPPPKDHEPVLCDRCGGWPALHRGEGHALCERCWAGVAR